MATTNNNNLFFMFSSFYSNTLLIYIIGLYLWPSVISPPDMTLDKYRCPLMGDTVTMTDEDVLIAQMIDSTVASSLVLFLVALKNQRSPTLAHVDAVTVEVWTIDRLGATHRYSVVALGTTTAVVPRHKEVIPASMLENEGGLDGVGACILGRRVVGLILGIGRIATGNGAGTLDVER